MFGSNIYVSEQIVATKPLSSHPKWWWIVRESHPKCQKKSVFFFSNYSFVCPDISYISYWFLIHLGSLLDITPLNILNFRCFVEAKMARASCHNLQVSLGNGLDMRNIAVGNYSPCLLKVNSFYFLPWDLSPLWEVVYPGKKHGWKYILQVVLSFFQLLFMSNAYPSNLVVFRIYISLHKT